MISTLQKIYAFIKSHKRQLLSIAVALLLCLACFVFLSLAALGVWLLQNWGLLSMEELVYHLQAPMEGAAASMVWSATFYCIPGLLLVGILAWLWVRLGSSRRKRAILAIVALLSSILLCVISLARVWLRLDVGLYLENRRATSTFLEENYVNPHTTPLQFPATKRNLIYIVLESMESSFMDTGSGGEFETNYIPELAQLAQDNVNFSHTSALGGMQTLPGTSWTIASLFSQSSGLPFNIPIAEGTMEGQTSFFPDVLSLGDILQQNGYQQTFFIGSDATFGGRRLYYTTHGDYDIRDYPYAIENMWLPEDYRQWWGYEDQKLYDYAKTELRRLSKSDTPFNFTMLTADTHHIDGYTCPLCQNDYEEPLADVVACASRQAVDFVGWIQQQDFYENTTIVLVGDHLSMNPTFCTDVPPEKRTIYNAFINSAVDSSAQKNRIFSTYDMFPTILASLGVKIRGEQLALGVNLFSGHPTLPEQYGLDVVRNELSTRSLFYEQFTREIVIPTSSVSAA